MRPRFEAFLLTATLLVCAILHQRVCYAEEDAADEESDVLVLTGDNFDDLVNGEKIILVEFYAPWCGHCKALAPEYSKAASLLKTAAIPVPLAKCDATEHKALAERFDISGYPTLYVFRNGEKEEYTGPRDAMGIVNYMRERSDPNWKPPPSAVVTLTDGNFTAFLAPQPLVLVEFYAPWCGHCKQLAPEYEKAAAELKGLIPLAKVDGTSEKSTVEKHKVSGWPTLIVFRNGKPFEYKGPRTAPGIVSYMKDESKLPTTEVATPLKAKNAFNKYDVTVFGIFSSESSKLYSEYVDAANNLRNKFTFLHSFDADVMREYGITDDAVLVYQPEIFQSKYEKKRHVLNDREADAKDVENFMMKNSVPLVGHRMKSNADERYSSRPLVVVYYDVNFSFQHRAATQIVRQKVVNVAKDFPQITFCISQEEEFEEDLKQLGLDESGSDVNVGFFDAHKRRYAMEPDDDFEEDTLRDFVAGVLRHEIEPRVISQPIPVKNDSPVKVVVAKSFDELVLKSDKDVLLEFYAPWCGHCKALEPTYLKLAKKMENRELIVAKMDAIANDVPEGFNVTGFPTIYFLPADKKGSPVLFEGSDRNIKTLTAFVDDHAFHKAAKDEL